MASLKKNFLYNAILTVSGYIFPLMVYPYVSRVLGVENIGACNFVDSIVDYFTILSMMGMNTVGIREIAKCKNDRAELDKTFSELFSLNTIMTVLAVAVLLIAVFTVPKFQAYRELLYIGVGKLFFNYMLINWFFQGLEDFKYITARYIVVKMLFVASVFLFVRTKQDVLVYYLLIALTWAVNGIINFFYARKFVSFHFTIHIRRTLVSSFFIMGVYWIMNSMYTTFNVAFLGFVTNDTEVGYYTTANKILTIIIAVFTTLTTILIPKMSQMLKNAKANRESLQDLLGKIFEILNSFSIPLIFFVVVFCPEIIHVVAGKGYEGAIAPLCIMSPLFFLIGCDQILVLQLLMPMGHDKEILRNSVLAAIVGVVGNIILVLPFGKLGSSIIMIAAELTVLITSYYCLQKSVTFRFPLIMTAKYLAASLPIIFIAHVVKNGLENPFASLLVGACITAIYVYVVGMVVLNNTILRHLTRAVVEKVRR